MYLRREYIYKVGLFVIIGFFSTASAFGLVGQQSGSMTLPPDTLGEWWFEITSECRDGDGVPSAWAELAMITNPELEWGSVASKNVFRRCTFLPPAKIRPEWHRYWTSVWFDTKELNPGAKLSFVFAAKSELTPGQIGTRIVIVTNVCTLKVEPYKINTLSAVKIGGNSTCIQLSWSDPSGGMSSIQYYSIYRKTGDSIQWKQLDSAHLIFDSIPKTIHSCQDTSGQAGENYWYMVIGYDLKRRVIAYSNNSLASYNTPAFSLISPFEGDKIDSLLPLFDWADYTCDYFSLFYDTLSSFNTATIVSGITQSSYLPTVPLLDKHHYFWKVCAINNGDSVWSNETGWIFGIDTLNTPPNSFSLLIPQNGSTITNTVRPFFQWEKSADEGDFVSYSILISYDSLFSSPIEIKNITSPYFIPHKSLLQDTVIYWKVKAIDRDSLERYCIQQFYRFIINFDDPPSPFSRVYPHWHYLQDSLPVIEVGLRPTFDWQDAIDPDGDPITYTLKYSTDSMYLDSVVIEGLTESQYTPLSDLKDNSVYFWDVWASDGVNITKSLGKRPWGFVVNSANQNPNTFNIINPPLGDTIDTRNPLFEWQYTVDPDPNDVVVFKTLSFSPDSTFNYKREIIMNKENTFSHTQPTPYVAPMWHPDTIGALEGKSWWVSMDMDTIIGYYNEWLQVMRTPAIDLSSATAPVQFKFTHRFSTEGPWWDGGTIRISTDGGRNFNVIFPIVGSYNTDSIYAFRYHGEGYNVPGFSGDNINWQDVVFDLSSFIGDTIILEIAFASDKYTSTPGHPTLFGWKIDNLVVFDANDTLLFDDGGDTEQKFYPISQGLSRGKTYYWKVEAVDLKNNPLGGQTFSQTGKFTVRLLPIFSGFACLDDSADSRGIIIKLKAKSPIACDDSTFTDSVGHYSISVKPGLYDIIMFKPGYGVIKVERQEIENCDVTFKKVFLRNNEQETTLVVSGCQSGRFSSAYNFLVWDSLRVNNNDTLIIEPGVTIRFDSLSIFRVCGLLKAEGSSADSIYFTSSRLTPQPGDWQGIRFESTADSNSVIKFSHLKYSRGLWCYGRSPVFHNNTVSHNQNSQYLIYITGATIHFMNNIVAKNVNNSKLVRFNNISSASKILNNTFVNRVEFYGGMPLVANNIFYNGLYSSGGANPIKKFNDILVYGGPSQYVTVNYNGDSCDANYNIKIDPIFVDTANGNFNVAWNSPCVDAGDPTTIKDPDSTISDIGARYYNQSAHPSAPSGLTAQYENSKNILSWRPNNESDIFYYKIYRSDRSWPKQLIDSVFHPETTFVDSPVNNVYFYRVRAVDLNYNHSIHYSNEVCAPVDSINISGYAFLACSTNHGGIKVLFSALTPTAKTDSTFTDSSGFYSMNNLHLGTYTITYSKSGFTPQILNNKVIFYGTNLDTVYFGIFLSGNLKGRLSKGLYRVTDSIYVQPQDTLIIDPGVRLEFDGYYKFVIYGLLLASGAEDDSIVFTRRLDTQRWAGLKFINASNNSRLEYVIVEYGATTSDGRGGGIYCENTSPTIIHCSIRNNGTLSCYQGGGIYTNTSLTLNHCVISNNTALDGGGTWNVGSLNNCTVVYNYAHFHGGGIGLAGQVKNSIIYFNTAVGSPGSAQIFGVPTVNYSNIQGGWSGQGNINVDPLFVNAAQKDYCLRWGSPCIDAGNPNSPFDPDSTITDMGARYFDQRMFSIPKLRLPYDSSYLNTSNTMFVWTKCGAPKITYTFQCAIDSLFNAFVIDTSGIIDSCYTPVLSLNDSIYYWRVEAVDSNGVHSGFQKHPFMFTLDTQSPEIPVLYMPISGIYISDTFVSFEWSAVLFENRETESRLYSKVVTTSKKLHKDERTTKANKQSEMNSPVKYILEIDTLIGFVSPILVDTIDTTAGMHFLNENYPYFWRVKAFDLSGNQGGFASPESFGVDITPPIIDSTTICTDTAFMGPFEIKTKVTDFLSGVDSVLLYYRRDEDSTWVIKRMHSFISSHWFLDTIPAVGHADDSVRYYIKALDKSHDCNIATDPLGAPVNYYAFRAYHNIGVEEDKEIVCSRFSFKIKSNPALSSITFIFTSPAVAKIHINIYDVTGRLVEYMFANFPARGNYTLSTKKKLSTGIYFYTLECPWIKKKGKVVLLNK